MQIHFKAKDALRNYLRAKIHKLEREIKFSQTNTLAECLELSKLRQSLRKNTDLLEELNCVEGAEGFTIEV